MQSTKWSSYRRQMAHSGGRVTSWTSIGVIGDFPIKVEFNANGRLAGQVKWYAIGTPLGVYQSKGYSFFQ